MQTRRQKTEWEMNDELERDRKSGDGNYITLEERQRHSGIQLRSRETPAKNETRTKTLSWNRQKRTMRREIERFSSAITSSLLRFQQTSQRFNQQAILHQFQSVYLIANEISARSRNRERHPALQLPSRRVQARLATSLRVFNEKDLLQNEPPELP